jgi:hypothetical protein
MGEVGEFEANNCLPATWLALFEPKEYVIEREDEDEDEDDEEYVVVGYKTTALKASQRVKTVINQIKGQTPVWAFLKPLEILWDELALCSEEDVITLDLTQLWAIDESYEQKIQEAVWDFRKMLQQFNGSLEYDLSLLNQFIGAFALGPTLSVMDLSAEEKMFVMIGTYYGDEEHEDLYSLEYFGEEYWAV